MVDEAQSAILKLARESRSWKSIDLKTRTDMAYHMSLGLAEEPYDEKQTHYIETSDGKRMLLAEFRAKDGRTSRVEGYCDGGRCCQLLERKNPKQPEVRIGNSFLGEGMSGSTSRPDCLVYLYVGKVPLDVALVDAKPLGPATVIGRDVDQFLFPQVRWGMVQQDLVYSLDCEFAIPLRVESFRSEGARSDATPLWTWTARKLELFGGHPIVSDSEHITYSEPRPGKPNSLVVTERDRVVSVEFDREFPASTFWPAISSESLVVDAIQKKITIPKQTTASVVSQPIRVDPPRDWIGVASQAGIGLGVLLVLVGIYRWSKNSIGR